MSSPTFEVKAKAVKAGAGAGKTYNLTIDVIDFAKTFFARYQRWPRVVVTTFTKKATQELSERILKKAMEDDGDLLPFVNSGYYLQVSTIHGVLDKMLKECGALIGLRRDFSYLTNAEASFLSKKVLKNILDQNKEFLQLSHHYSFRDIQRLVFEAQDQSLEGYSCVTELDLYRILDKELSEAKNKLIKTIGDLRSTTLTERWQDVVNTLEAIVLYLKINDWDKNYKIVTELVAKIKLNGLKPRKESFILDIYDDFKQCIDHLRLLSEPYYQPSCIELASEYNKQFSVLLQTYVAKLHQEKKDINKIEIADLEVFAQQLILNHKYEVQKYSTQFDYWVVDEFQDTSPLQLELLTTLIGHTPYYIVGDPQQSIYLFRGARAEVFSQAVDAVQKKNGDFLQLTKNYRSENKVLRVINHLSQKLGVAFSPMESTKSNSNDAPGLYLQPYCDEKSEIDYLFKHIQVLLNQGAQFKDIAILVRKNNQLKQVGDYLSSHNVPAHLSSSGQFWRRREILDCIVLLKFLLNPNDENNLLALLRMPFLPSSDEDIVKWCHRENSLWLHLCTVAATDPTVVILNHLLLQTSLKGYVYSFIDALRDLRFFDKHLIYDPSGRSEGNVWMFIHKLRAFEKNSSGNFFDFISECEKAEILESTSDATGAIDNNKVAVMTIHAAKGLQFEHVILPFLGDELYIENKKDFLVDEVFKKWCIRTPLSVEDLSTGSSLYEKNILSHNKNKLQEEDLRLFYVAITRAIKSIYVSWKKEVKSRSWSCFFNDLQLDPGDHAQDVFSYRVYNNEISAVNAFVSVQDDVSVCPQYQQLQSTADTNSVTDLLALAQFKQTDAHFYKIRTGILFHRLLENLAKPVTMDIRQTIENWFGSESEEVSEALNYCLQLNEPPMTLLLKTGKPEWGFLNQEGESYVQGQIDLWGVVDNVLWVIDYKSGQYMDEQKLIHQLTSYALALKKYLSWTQEVKMGVVYPFAKKTFIRNV